MKIIASILALLLVALAFGQGGYVGPKGYIGPNGYVGGASGGPISPGWVFGQDLGLAFGTVQQCTSTTLTACTFAGFLPTTANSGLAVEITTSNNVTISSVTGCGGTWNLVPASACHLDDATNSIDLDCAYNVTNTGACTSLVINVSGAPGASGIQPSVTEFIPPAGASAVFDVAGTAHDASCTTCNLVSLTTTGTDAIVQWTDIPNDLAITTGDYNPFTSPYRIDFSAQAIALNVPSGTITATGTSSPAKTTNIAALAFKSSYGNFSTPSAVWSPVTLNLDANTTNAIACSSGGCSVTVQSTAGSKAFVLWAMTSAQAQGHITSCSLGATNCTVPNGANTCQLFNAAVGEVSCALIASDPSGITTLSIATSTSANYYFGTYEFTKTTGTASIDAQNSAYNSSASNTPPGLSLSLTGTSDLVFHAVMIKGNSLVANQCIQNVSLIPFPYETNTNCTGQVYGVTETVGAVGFTMNQPSAPAETWSIYDNLTSVSIVSALALK